MDRDKKNLCSRRDWKLSKIEDSQLEVVRDLRKRDTDMMGVMTAFLYLYHYYYPVRAIGPKAG